ncbi:zinc dependent phospholipase C family protein [Rhizobium sp. IBUN]|uniref:zinc dependent phospholipase C family protein n=1 Tax=Rhizobium sp. IBUN TaxID=1042326 RepID=UPI0012EC1DAA
MTYPRFRTPPMHRTITLATGVGIAISLAFASSASAWSLKTHFWIGQQVLNDALDDGRVELGGNSYEVAPPILNALRSNPNQYRMGNLGPDVFPDPIVGQMTTHPGVTNGWQTDDWLRKLVGRASSPTDIAFSYGFVAHAAGDIFAHSYVNALAGDIFLLTDGERDVERRHFLLEKYIESLTPAPLDAAGNTIDLEASLGTPAEFLRDTLILDEDVATQNFKADQTGAHLTAMYEVRNGVRLARQETQNLIESITTFGADRFKEQAKLQIDLATGKAALDAAEASLSAAEKLLAVKKSATDAALGALDAANRLIHDYPELLTFQEKLLAEQLKAAADAVNFAAQTAANIANQVKELQGKISDLRGKIGNLACEALLYPPAVEKCKEAVGNLNGEISKLEGDISGLNAQVAAANEAAQIAQANVDGTKRTIDDLTKRQEEAVKGVAQGTYQAAVDVARAEQEAQEKIVAGARKAVDELRKIQERIASELEKVTAIVDEIKKVIDKYNGITFLIDNWLGDIDQATAKYIDASHRAGIKMLLSQGNPLSEYTDWYSCYGSVYTAAPIEIGEATCAVKNFIEELNQKFDDAIAGLPEILQWLVFPSRTAQKKVVEKLKPELRKAGLEIVGFLTDKTTSDFLDLLSDPSNANRDRLNSAYNGDTSGKNLLRFSDVASVVDADVALSNSRLDPAAFAALNSAVVLAKLSLLQPDALNQLIADKVGVAYDSPRYGTPVYPPYAGSFSALFGAVRSIDGNHQWQAHALPYARNQAHPASGPGRYNYGHDYWQNRQMGLRIWVDPYLREKVFLKLFPEGILGSSRNRKDLSWPLYPFPECPLNPFPSTQSAFTGEILREDRLCVDAANPNIPAAEFETSSPEEYATSYLQCGTVESGFKYWTFIASYKTEQGAQRYARLVEARYADLKTALWRPVGAQGHWGVLLAACTTKDKAVAAMALSLRRGIASDTFVWMSDNPIWSDRAVVTLAGAPR